MSVGVKETTCVWDSFQVLFLILYFFFLHWYLFISYTFTWDASNSWDTGVQLPQFFFFCKIWVIHHWYLLAFIPYPVRSVSFVPRPFCLSRKVLEVCFLVPWLYDQKADLFCHSTSLWSPVACPSRSYVVARRLKHVRRVRSCCLHLSDFVRSRASLTRFLETLFALELTSC